MHDRQSPKAHFFHLAERWLGTVGKSISMGPHEIAFARDTLKVPAERRLMIPAGIDTEEFCPVTPERKRLLREKFGVPADVKLLGTVGRFSLQKDPATLYAALARVLPKAPNLYFAHLGDGELAPQIDAFLEGQPMAARIKRVPYLADSAQFYQMLDGFILASRYEGLSYAAQEAFACNLPGILTDAPGNADLAIYRFSHITKATPGEVESVADAILTWYHTDGIGAVPNHREVVLKNLCQSICNSRILAAYEKSVIEKPQKILSPTVITSPGCIS
jgi:glycosyltransferase involved in cell wall biosynthesis